MKTSFLRDQIVLKKSFLCLGLDSDLDKIPKHLLNESDPIFTFNKILLDSLNKLIVAVKINTAFYEAYGHKGWKTLERTIKYINKNYPDLFTIADAKRGDIGNTSDKYAKAFFSSMDFDSVTVSPYMGNDSVEPFLAYNNKHTILLALTSNKGSNDFQISSNQENNLFKKVVNKIKAKGYYINNLDINIITQTPKIKKYKKKMIENIAKLCEISKNQINIKGKTTEKLGIIGKEKAIACEVIISVIKYD